MRLERSADILVRSSLRTAAWRRLGAPLECITLLRTRMSALRTKQIRVGTELADKPRGSKDMSQKQSTKKAPEFTCLILEDDLNLAEILAEGVDAATGQGSIAATIEKAKALVALQ